MTPAKLYEILKNRYKNFSLHEVDYDALNNYSSELNSGQLNILRATIRNRDITINARNILSKKIIKQREIGKLLNEHQKIKTFQPEI